MIDNTGGSVPPGEQPTTNPLTNILPPSLTPSVTPPDGYYGPPSTTPVPYAPTASTTTTAAPKPPNKVTAEDIKKEESRDLALINARQARLDAGQGVDEWSRYRSKKKVMFNPPPIGYSTGSRMYGLNKPRQSLNTEDRDFVLGSKTQYDRIFRKANLTPDLTYPGDWDTESTEGVSFDPSKVALFNVGDNGGFVVYGFKFMYNPSALDFGVSPTTGVNVGYILSGKDTAMPLGAVSGGGSIGMSFPISRVDDLQAIHKDPASGKYVADPLLWGTKKDYTTFISQAQIAGIANRGTMYDLEFLFRTTLGRAWKTVYRGDTADVGLMFSVPLRLALGPKMVYRVRVDSVSYSHRSFTPDMIPIYTEVSINFSRIPDVQNKYATAATTTNESDGVRVPHQAAPPDSL